MSYRYMIETYQHANELLDLYSEGQRDILLEFLDENYPDQFLPLSDARMTSALRFLAETPSQRDRRWQKLTSQEQAHLWMDSRFLALQAANAVAISENVSMWTAGKYRKATRNIAEAVHGLHLRPTALEIAHLPK